MPPKFIRRPLYYRREIQIQKEKKNNPYKRDYFFYNFLYFYRFLSVLRTILLCSHFNSLIIAKWTVGDVVEVTGTHPTITRWFSTSVRAGCTEC
jgi:hypothetical protein